VQYSPELRVLCAVPGGFRYIRKNRRRVKVKAPAHIWIQYIYRKNHGGGSGYHTNTIAGYTVKMKTLLQNQIMLGGMAHGGCWGNVKKPTDLRQANTRFWASGFMRGFDTGYWHDNSKDMLGKEFCTFKGPLSALLISNDPQILKKLPNKCSYKTAIGSAVIIPLIEEDDTLQTIIDQKIYQIEQDPVSQKYRITS
jgi:hypothetical protein